jgi:hypothetical protein
MSLPMLLTDVEQRAILRYLKTESFTYALINNIRGAVFLGLYHLLQTLIRKSFFNDPSGSTMVWSLMKCRKSTGTT